MNLREPNSSEEKMRYLGALLLLSLAGNAWAQGIVLDRRPIVVPPPRPTPRVVDRIRLQEHRVLIRIVDQAARVEVERVFFNPNPWPAEGVYLFPLPEKAAVSKFTLSMGGRQVPGELLDANRAREIYRRIVHRRRDPGLLEYAGRRLLRARIFPIPPRGQARITLAYEQLLNPVGGVLELVYPLKSDRFAPGPVKVSGKIEVHAEAGVQTLFSPTHKLDVVKQGPQDAVASFEESRFSADRDLRLLFTLGRRNFGLALASHKPPAEDGTFLMLIAPHTGFGGGKVMPKDIVFVVDTSGSMGERGGRKIAQAKSALAYALGRLGKNDRFNVIAFSTEARAFRDQPVPATTENLAAAQTYVKGLEATGGTAIDDALKLALQVKRTTGRVPIVFFLTDGQPTIGPSDPKTILADTAAANRAGARIFVFGVGNDVNTVLLTELARRNRGTGHFVSEQESIELKVSALYEKVAAPVLADATLTVGGAEVYDLYPRRVGDLFKGQQLAIVGRYRKPGPCLVTLKGKVGKKEVSYVYEGILQSRAEREDIARLWAVRKVGFLLDEIRRNGENRELVETIKRLGTRYGIVTPYTSFLVVEERKIARRGFAGGLLPPDSPAGKRLRRLEKDREAASDAGEALKAKRPSGAGAVAGARLVHRLAFASQPDQVTGIGVRRIGAKTFRLQEGVWVDLELERETHKDASRVVVRYLGEEYDKLIEDATLARYLSAGPKMRLIYEGVIYEIVEN